MAQLGQDIDKAIALLQSDKLVGVPTETVYGLAGNALSEKAILRIYQTKNRPKFDPLIAHTNSLEKVKNLVAHVPEKALALAGSFWPGPLTMLLERTARVSDLLTSGLPRVAIRIPNHHITLELLERLDFPLAAPSANPFGYVSPTEAIHVDNQLGDKIEYVLDGGKCEVGIESTIVGFEGNQVVVHRLGGMKLEDLEALVGKVRLELNQSSNPIAPGMMQSHYSPGKKVLLGDIEENFAKVDGDGIGIISFRRDYQMANTKQVVLSTTGDMAEAARNIFAALRQMDDSGVKLVLAELVPSEGLGLAINDRLQRAAAK